MCIGERPGNYAKLFPNFKLVSVTRDRIQNAATFQYQSKLDGLRLYLKDNSTFYPTPFSRDVHVIFERKC